MLKIIDLFAGCGGLSLGFQRAGFDVVAAFDNWKEACAVYAQNFDHPVFEIDLSAIDDTHLLSRWRPEMIIGGPPCQDFSSAGKRDETGSRADLTMTFVKLISDIRPEWFVMENVERITKSKLLTEALSVVKTSGYGISQTVLDASYCGVPQSRKRFFMIGKLQTPDGFLDDYLRERQAAKPMTIHDYLGEKLPLNFYYRHPRSYACQGVFSVHEPSPTIRGVNRPIPKNYKKHDGDLCEPNENLRPLTTLERSYIQTFPPNFIWLGSKTNREQLIGNAVPVNLAKYVADCIADYITRPDKSQSHRPVINRMHQLELF